MQHFLCSVLRYSLDLPADFPPSLSEGEWLALHKWAEKQSLVGVMYGGVQRLARDPSMEMALVMPPPRHLVLRWSMEAEHIRGLNRQVDEVSARLTNLFQEQGACCFILKGSANALLYPVPSLRQTGDVDIWVEGGRRGVVNLLTQMGLAEGLFVSSVHAHLANSLFGMDVEVHFLATEQYAPNQNNALQKFLTDEVPNAYGVPAGFNVPSTTYSLMMQLSHIKQHLFSSGIGLRQLVDYHQILQHSTENERSKVSANLKACGLDKMAGAVMWALQEVLALDEKLMLCKPDKSRGSLLLKIALDGGNFGWYAEGYKQPVVVRWFKDRVRFVRLLSFDANESFWREIKYWVKTISLIPRRIKQRRLALGKR